MNIAHLNWNEAGELAVISHEWTVFLSEYFKKLQGIKSYQHFEFASDSTVKTKEFVNGSSVTHNLLKAPTPLPARFPEEKPTMGIDNKCANYLCNMQGDRPIRKR